MACRQAGVQPASSFGLSRLRQLGVAGSPLPVEGYRWVSEQFGSRVLLNVGSGGTDVCLGVDAMAFDEQGRPVVGQLGELVIVSPMPSMPVGFWGDTDGSRYRSTYFEDFPGVWRHGDWTRFSAAGSCIIAGRSDATLNRGGVRLGTAEFYRVVEELPEVVDSLVLREGAELDGALRRTITTSLRTALSPRHIPDSVITVPAIPRNRTGKKLELPVKKILQGAKPDEVASRDVLADPASLDAYVAYAAERRSE
jgi:acetoacetyl-CoA synthetase